MFLCSTNYVLRQEGVLESGSMLADLRFLDRVSSTLYAGLLASGKDSTMTMAQKCRWAPEAVWTI
jgi:hypothetical protein